MSRRKKRSIIGSKNKTNNESQTIQKPEVVSKGKLGITQEEKIEAIHVENKEVIMEAILEATKNGLIIEAILEETKDVKLEAKS